MYSRFTDRARMAMTLANEEANRFNHDYIGTEHILLGLIRGSEGVASNVLKNLDVNLGKVRSEVQKIIVPGPGKETSRLNKPPQTPRAKRVIEFAIEEARGLRHNYVGTEHLLLGLLREEEGVAAQVLNNLGLSLNAVRDEILMLFGPFLRDADVKLLERPSVPKMPLLPPEVEQAIKVVEEHCRWLCEQKEQAVAACEFDKAAELRDQADRLIRNLNDVLRNPR
jgi:ATP-dependent Clp protease ATP-binding subunit ClpA